MPWGYGGQRLPSNMSDLELRGIQGEASVIPIRYLPQTCRDFLSNVLDPESALGRSDYRRFGELLGLSHFQIQGCRARNRDRSITDILLTEFGHEPIWKLITILHQMEVSGVREILTSWQEIRRNYETEQRLLAGSYQGGVQNTESQCSCMNCHQNPSIRGYTYLPHHPQDESFNRRQPCQSFMPHPRQAWQPHSNLSGLKGDEGQMVGLDTRMMMEMKEPRPGISRTFELTQTGPDTIRGRQFVANIDQDSQSCKDRGQGSLQRMISDEDNCSYGIGWGEVEPADAMTRNNGLGDEDSTQNHGPGGGNRVQTNGPDDGNHTKNYELDNGNSTQNNEPGDGTRFQNSGPSIGNNFRNSGGADEDSTQNNGPTDRNRAQNNGVVGGTRVQSDGVGDEVSTQNSGDRNGTQDNGPGDGTRFLNNGPGDRNTKVLLNHNGHDGQQEFYLPNNGHGNGCTTPPNSTLDEKSILELDNKDWLADWDSFSTSGRNLPKITRNEQSSPTRQMANHNNNGKPFKLNPVASDNPASPKSTNYCSTYPSSMPTDNHAHSLPPYGYSEYGFPNNEAHPLHQTMQKRNMYYNNITQIYRPVPEPYYRNPQTLQGAPQNFRGTPQTVQYFPQTVQGANQNVQCFPRNIQAGHFQMTSHVPQHHSTRRGPPLHGMGRESHVTQQGVPDARNWHGPVPHTSEITPAKKTVTANSDHYQYTHDVPAADIPVPRGLSTSPSDRPPAVENGMIVNEKGQVKLRGQDSREGTEKRLSAVVGEVYQAQQHRRHGSDEGGAARGREAESEPREREKYVFITGGDGTYQDAVARNINKICQELRRLGITVVADLPDKFQAVPRDPLQGRNSISFRRDNIHEARMAYFERATCVLMIVSPGYKTYVDKDNDQAQAQPTEHQSSTRHIYTLMLTEYCEKNFSKNKRFYPVCLTKLETKRSDIPDWIASTLTYCFPGKELFRHLKQDFSNRE